VQTSFNPTSTAPIHLAASFELLGLFEALAALEATFTEIATPFAMDWR